MQKIWKRKTFEYLVMLNQIAIVNSIDGFKFRQFKDADRYLELGKNDMKLKSLSQVSSSRTSQQAKRTKGGFLLALAGISRLVIRLLLSIEK